MTARLKIVIADDDADDVFFFEEAFKKLNIANYSLISFRDGRQTLDYLKATQTAEDRPTMIVLDLNMPILDGISVLREIKRSAILKDIPIFILTTSKSPNDRKTCKELGCSEYYIKPIKLAELTVIIKDILSKLEWLK